MPTNLKNLLSRSRSRNELKGRGDKEEEPCPCESGTCSAGLSEVQHQGPHLPCQCHSSPPGPPGRGEGVPLRRDVSSRSLFSLPGDEPTPSLSPPASPPTSPSSPQEESHSHSGGPIIRKCETVLALSTFSSNGVGPVPSSQSSAGGRVRLMKDKILSTSASALNSIIHSSNKTTSKLFSGLKLSSGTGSASQSNNCVNSGSGGGKFHVPANTGINRDSALSKSQASVFEEAPLTPMNRLRRNGSVNNNHLPACTISRSRYSSVSSVVEWKEDTDQEEIFCRLCLCPVKLQDTVDIQACSCRYCKDCVTAYVSFEVNEAAYDIACPDSTCEKGVLSLVEIEALVSSQLMEKHKKFRLNIEVERDCELMWCPTPGCETICKIQESVVNGASPRTPVIQCTRCQHVFCTECKLPCHPDVTCEIYRQKLIRQGKLSLVDEEPFASYDSIKKCPFCHVPIEKDSGCAQMMCKRCKHVFCWYCLASLDDDFLLRHYDKGPCKNKLGHSRASVVWHRTQVIGIFAGFGLLVLLASPLLILAAPCLLCCKCRYCTSSLDPDDSPVSI